MSVDISSLRVLNRQGQGCSSLLIISLDIARMPFRGGLFIRLSSRNLCYDSYQMKCALALISTRALRTQEAPHTAVLYWCQGKLQKWSVACQFHMNPHQFHHPWNAPFVLCSAGKLLSCVRTYQFPRRRSYRSCVSSRNHKWTQRDRSGRRSAKGEALLVLW